MTRFLAALVLTMVLASTAAAAEVAVGEAAPDFTLKDHTGTAVTLSSWRGRRPVLVAFYPKSFTGG